MVRVTLRPTASAMELQGQGYILASVGEASGEVPFTAYFAAQSKMAEDPELTSCPATAERIQALFTQAADTLN